jgi:short-subunit dehydrogenase
VAHVIITGGSSGIGAALARASAARGDDVTLIARTETALAAQREALVSEFGKHGRRFAVQSADVGDPTALGSAIQRCEHELGPCDTLITSAGIVVPGRFDSLPPEQFENQVRINFLGTVNAVRAVYPGMKARRRGKILMVGSGLSLIGVYGYTAYCASKYAVAGFAEALRAEARPYGVTVSICFPPDTETPQLLAERSLRPPEAHAAIGAGGMRSADEVARAALAGLHRGQFAIYPGLQMKMLGMFGSVALPFLRPWFDRRILLVKRTSKDAE